MPASLDDFLNPAHYHANAVAAAATADLNALDPQLLIIRLAIELRRGHTAEAAKALKALAATAPASHNLFQMTSGAMILAYQTNDKAAFDQALEAWLAARQQFPANWLNTLLDVPEFAAWLAGIDPSRLAPPVITPPPLTDEDRAFVTDLEGATVAAVAENLEWLREMGFDASVAAIAKDYRLGDVNIELREATLFGDGDLPSLIIVLHEDGSFDRSFIAH